MSKKYGQDEVGYQAALLTYYGFLALFPLLLTLTTLTERLVGRYPRLESKIISGITDYFPLLGNQLSSHVHGLRSSGLALAVGILFTLYGARGVAMAFRRCVRHIWGAPRDRSENLLTSGLKNMTIIIVGGLGFMLASVSAGLAGAYGRGWMFRGLSIMVNVLVLFWLFSFLINFCLPRHVKLREIRLGAVVAAIGLVTMQYAGTYLLARQLKNLDALYSYFAVALALLFWIYLQAQILCYAIEIAVVGSRKLWPRSLDDQNPTTIDRQLSE